MGASPFSARLVHGLKQDSVVWLLRCSVLGEAPMASAKNIQFQKVKVLGKPESDLLERMDS
jgi:hypothetical protein